MLWTMAGMGGVIVDERSLIGDFLLNRQPSINNDSPVKNQKSTMPDSVVSLLADLVSIDSVNPSLAAGARGEENVARRIGAELDAIGCVIDVTYVAPDRPNIVGVLNGRAPGRTLMFCGHSDTVGVDGMTKPFGAEIRSEEHK